STFAGTVALTADSTLNVDGTQLTLSGVISGARAEKRRGAGILILSGKNTYSGATNVNAGTLAVTVNNALGTNAEGTTIAKEETLAVTVNNALGTNAAGTTVANGAVLDFRNVTYSTTEGITVDGRTITTSTGTSTFAGTVALTADSTLNVDGTQLTLSGVISGA